MSSRTFFVRHAIVCLVAETTHSLYSFQEIAGYIERQYDDILAEESRIKRNPRFRDNRVHAMLYFITPTGHAYVEQVNLGGTVNSLICLQSS